MIRVTQKRDRYNIIMKIGKMTRCQFLNVNCYKALTVDDIMTWCTQLNSEKVLVVIESLDSFEVHAAVEVIKHLTCPIFINDEYIYDDLKFDNVTFTEIQLIPKQVEEITGIPQPLMPRKDLTVETSTPIIDITKHDELGEVSVVKTTADTSLELQEQLEKLSLKYEMLKEDYEQKNTEIQELRTNLEKLESALVTEQRKAISLGKEKARLEGKLELTSEKLADSQQKYTNKDSECKALNEALINKEADLQDTQGTISDLLKGKESLRVRVDTLETDLKLIQGDLTKVQEERNSMDTRVKELQGIVDEKDSEVREGTLKISNLEANIHVVTKQVDDLKKKSDTLAKNAEATAKVIVSKQATIEDLTKKLSDKEYIVSELQVALAENANENSELTSKLSDLTKQVAALTRKLEEANTSKERMCNSATKYQVALNKATEQLNRTRAELRKAQQAVTSNTNEIELETLRQELDEQGVALETARTELAEKTEENNKLQQELDDAQTKLNETMESLNTTQSKLSDIELLQDTKIAKAHEEKEKAVAQIQSEVTKLRSEAEGYATTVAQLGQNIYEMQTSLKTKENEIANLTNEKEQMMTTIQQLTQGTQITLSNYKGRARIVPVYGSGSYGVSLLAMSIAHKIEKSKVLVMDLDTRSPKLDKYTKCNPIIPSLVDIPNQLERSSFATFITHGVDYIKSNKDTLRRVEQHNRGVLDYFSGLYIAQPQDTILKADYEGLFNYLGNIYDYIILDLGLLGNPITDKFIYALSGIAYKEVLVTQNDVIDTRAAVVHMVNINCKMSNVIWVLNLSQTTTLSQSVKQLTEKAHDRVVLTMSSDMYGSDRTLDRIPIVSGMFTKIIQLLQ